MVPATAFIVLLDGFSAFCYGRRQQIEPLAAAGFPRRCTRYARLPPLVTTETGAGPRITAAISSDTSTASNTRPIRCVTTRLSTSPTCAPTSFLPPVRREIAERRDITFAG